MLFITQPRVGITHNEILALQMAAREYDWNVISAPSSWRLDQEIIDSKDFGIPYGSQLFCEVIAQQMGWKLLAQPFDWLAKLPKQYTKRQIDFMTLGEAKKLQETKFIKPADDKCFNAKVYEPGKLENELFAVNGIHLSNDTPVLVSEVVKWDLEYRCFVSNYGAVLTWSNYSCYGNINDPKYHYMIPGHEQHITEFIDYMCWDQYDLMNGEMIPCVIDIGIIHGKKGWAVIESNPIWASGLYGCDPVLALSAMRSSVTKADGTKFEF